MARKIRENGGVRREHVIPQQKESLAELSGESFTVVKMIRAHGAVEGVGQAINSRGPAETKSHSENPAWIIESLRGRICACTGLQMGGIIHWVAGVPRGEINYELLGVVFNLGSWSKSWLTMVIARRRVCFILVTKTADGN